MKIMIYFAAEYKLTSKTKIYTSRLFFNHKLITMFLRFNYK
jgi:hypothetical protein